MPNGSKHRPHGPLMGKKDATERTKVLDRRTREKISIKMTTLRLRTGGTHQTSLASDRGRRRRRRRARMRTRTRT